MKDKAMSTCHFRGGGVLPISSTRRLRWLESFEMMARNIIISLSNFRRHTGHPGAMYIHGIYTRVYIKEVLCTKCIHACIHEIELDNGVEGAYTISKKDQKEEIRNGKS